MKIGIPFSELFLENMTLIRGTPPCTPHMEVPPGDIATDMAQLRNIRTHASPRLRFVGLSSSLYNKILMIIQVTLTTVVDFNLLL